MLNVTVGTVRNRSQPIPRDDCEEMSSRSATEDDAAAELVSAYTWPPCPYDRVTEFPELAGDPPATPGRILGGHSPNERDDFGTDRRASYRSRPPRPISREAAPMPRDDCRRLDVRQGIRPTPPQPRHDNPEGSVDRTEAWTRRRSTQDRKLLAKHEVFQDQMGSGTERGKRGTDNRHQNREHVVTLAQFGRRVTVESVRAFG